MIINEKPNTLEEMKTAFNLIDRVKGNNFFLMTNNFEFLTDSGVRIRQSVDGYRFTSDAIALANFFKCKTTDIVIDAGCGCGVISLLINDRFKPKRIVAVDIDEHAAAIARENVLLNNMMNIEVHHADIRTFHTLSFKWTSASNLETSQMPSNYSNIADVFVCNPPYFDTGPKSSSASRAIARHDDTLTLSDLVAAATRLLKYGGVFYICYPIDQIARAIQTLENHDFRVKQLHLLPHLVLIQAKKSKGNSSTKVTF